jgi:DNA-binding NtrC family response regulator/tetratricopeptide (TPR) repeat protein
MSTPLVTTRTRVAMSGDLRRWQMAAAVAVGRHAEAVEAARRVSRGSQLPELALQEAEALLPLSRYSESLAIVTRLLPRCGSAEIETRLRLVRSRGLFMTGRAQAAWVQLRRAQAIAPSDAARALCAEAEAQLHVGEQDLEQARECARRAWALHATCASPEGLARALEMEAGLLRRQGRFDEALATHGHRLEIASASTRLDLMAEARMDRGDLLAFVGRWEEGCRDCDSAIHLFRELSDPREHLVAGPRRARIDLARGDLDAVREALRRAAEATRRESSPWVLAEHALLASDLELASGQALRADAAAEEGLGYFALVRSAEGVCRSRMRRVHAQIALRRYDRALHEARRAVSSAPQGRPDVGFLAVLAEGRALLRVERDSAEASFARALQLGQARGGLSAAAQVGLSLARGAARDDASMTKALAELEAWGDRRLVEMALADVAELSAGPATRLEREVETPPAPRFPEIVGRSQGLQALFEQMARAARTLLAVHIFGETGTGKEKVAQALHRHSSVARGPFVAVNASSLSDELFEAEMFGHVKGAFTGAVVERRGHVAEADGGTLFIDEVADLSPRGQAKLLRFLQSGEYRRVGETLTRTVRVRVISAANVRLGDRVAEKQFRQDLLYRLAGLTLTLPPLRERGDDILLLARHFLRIAAEREGMACPSLGGGLAEELRRYSWPGNIRELENVVNQLVVMAAGGPLRREHLVIGAPAATGSAVLRTGRASFERDLIARCLAQNADSRTRTAASLGISRQALSVKIRQYGLD